MPTPSLPLEAFEAWDSQGLKVTAAKSGNSMTIKAIVTGTDDRAVAYAELIANLSNVLDLPPWHVVVADSIDMQPIAEEIWAATIEYISPNDANTPRQPKAIGEVTFEFDGTGGTTRIFSSINQERYPPTATDYHKWIDVDKENNPKGVDIVIPKLTFTLHQSFEGKTITLPWLRKVLFLTGHTNNDTFLGFAKGEVLFLGPAGQQPFSFLDNGQVVSGERDVTFRFEVSPNVTNLQIDDITGIKKNGHQYMWTKNEQVEQSGVLVPKAIAVYVDDAYPSADFSILGVNDPDAYRPIAGA